VSARGYAGRADFDAMTGFVGAALRARWPGVPYWHPGDLTWMLYPELDAHTDDVRLWCDDAGLVGFAWFYAPVFARFDLRPGADAALIDEMLDWAEARRRDGGGSGLSTIALDSDAERIAALEARGYRSIEHGNVHMRRSLETPIDESTLPDGMRFRCCVDVDLAERAACHRDAWSHLAHLGMRDVTSSFTLERYRKLREEPGYRVDLDLVVEAADGTHASCLIAWTDEASGVGLIEPVGTRDAFRRQGLGRALNLEALRRLRDAGMRQAQIGTTTFNDRAEATYLGCGFEILDRDRFWVKAL
jgi:GNAT superfamily N-acetyltransferase